MTDMEEERNFLESGVYKVECSLSSRAGDELEVDLKIGVYSGPGMQNREMVMRLPVRPVIGEDGSVTNLDYAGEAGDGPYREVIDLAVGDEIELPEDIAGKL